MVVNQLEWVLDIDFCHDVKNAIKVNADGIGLYRTEYEMLAKGNVLSEQEQFLSYTTVIDQMAGKPVYIRLFDLGGDKSAPWFKLAEENNPALGCCGARLLLSKPELLQVQARALARASQQSLVNVIYPMIATLEQFLLLKELFLEAIKDISNTNLHYGMMFEIPSACENAEALYEEIEFGRVGSNDLVQYLYAFDRTRDDYNYEALVSDSAIWNILTRLVSVARNVGKPLELCGAMADNPLFIPKLIQLGINTVSTHPENIATIRKAASNLLL